MNFRFALLASLICGGAHAQEAAFPSEFKVWATFPQKPEYTHYTIPAGESKVQYSMLRCTKGGIRFAIIINTVIPPLPRDLQARQVEMAKDIALRKPGTKLLSDEPFTIGPYTGRRFIYEEDDNAHIEQRVFFVGDSMYTIGVGAPRSSDFDSVAKDFFLSVRLAGNPPNKSPEATPDQRPPTTPSPSSGAPQL